MIYVAYEYYHKNRDKWSAEKPFGIFESVESACIVIDEKHTADRIMKGNLYDYYAYEIKENGQINRHSSTLLASKE